MIHNWLWLTVFRLVFSPQFILVSVLFLRPYFESESCISNESSVNVYRPRGYDDFCVMFY